MRTYIIKSGEIYKIGKTSNLDKRLKSFYTGNPDIQLLRVFEGDFERTLHKKYNHLRYKLEWFNLSEKEIKEIDDFIKVECENPEYKDKMTIYEQIGDNPKFGELLIHTIATSRITSNDLFESLRKNNTTVDILSVYVNNVLLQKEYKWKDKRGDNKHMKVFVNDDYVGFGIVYDSK